MCILILFYNKIRLMIRNIRVDTLKLRNKNYKQEFKTSIAKIKQNYRRSFEELIEDSSEYDEYIRSFGVM